MKSPFRLIQAALFAAGLTAVIAAPRAAASAATRSSSGLTAASLYRHLPKRAGIKAPEKAGGVLFQDHEPVSVEILEQNAAKASPHRVPRSLVRTRAGVSRSVAPASRRRAFPLRL